jgi:hypothetical protein
MAFSRTPCEYLCRLCMCRYKEQFLRMLLIQQFSCQLKSHLRGAVGKMYSCAVRSSWAGRHGVKMESRQWTLTAGLKQVCVCLLPVGYYCVIVFWGPNCSRNQIRLPDFKIFLHLGLIFVIFPLLKKCRFYPCIMLEPKFRLHVDSFEFGLHKYCCDFAQLK